LTSIHIYYEEITKEEYNKSIKTTKDCLDWVEKTIAESKTHR
jgi:hypothetical protein